MEASDSDKHYSLPCYLIYYAHKIILLYQKQEVSLYFKSLTIWQGFHKACPQILD